MAEIKVPRASVWQTFELETAFLDPPKIKLKLTPIISRERLKTAAEMESGTESQDFPFMVDKTINTALEHVTGWDITSNGKAIPCTPKNKERYLEPLMLEKVKGKPNVFLVMEIMGFITDVQNFVKN